MQLGKALEDPVQGINALKRVGVTFTDSQKDMIAAMVETGDVAGAQALILETLERQVGGAGEAEAGGLTGATHHLKSAWGNLLEELARTPVVGATVETTLRRIECPVGPSVQGGISLAIRCKHPFTPSWDQVGAGGDVVDYLRDAVTAEKNIIISGATNTGKTTLLNKLLGFLPDDRRVIAVEDTPELGMDRFWDGVGLLAARDAKTAVGMIGWDGPYDHLMRATSDHVVFGEVSIQNAFAVLAALNSGATGVMCSIHAKNAKQALDRKFDQNIVWSGATMPRVPEFLRELVDVVVQINRTTDGYQRISEIYEPRADRWVMGDDAMSMGERM